MVGLEPSGGHRRGGPWRKFLASANGRTVGWFVNRCGAVSGVASHGANSEGWSVRDSSKWGTCDSRGMVPCDAWKRCRKMGRIPQGNPPTDSSCAARAAREGRGPVVAVDQHYLKVASRCWSNFWVGGQSAGYIKIKISHEDPPWLINVSKYSFALDRVNEIRRKVKYKSNYLSRGHRKPGEAGKEHLRFLRPWISERETWHGKRAKPCPWLPSGALITHQA